MQVRGIDFVFTNVSDIEKSKAFYQDVLGIRDAVLTASEHWVEFDTKPVALSLGVGSDAGMGRPPSTAIALAVDDVPAAVEALRKQGVPILLDAMESTSCWIACVADPDGNRIYLHRRKDGTVG